MGGRRGWSALALAVDVYEKPVALGEPTMGLEIVTTRRPLPDVSRAAGFGYGYGYVYGYGCRV